MPAQKQYFVSISKSSRILIVIISLMTIVFFDLAFIFQSLLSPEIGWSVLGLNGIILILLIPFIFPPPLFGWLHPVAFFCISNLLYHFSRLSLYFYGLDSHPAIQSFSPAELNGLVTYELFLGGIAVITYYLGFFYSPKLRIPTFAAVTPRNLTWLAKGAVVFSSFVLAIYIQFIRGGLARHLLSWGEGRNRTMEGEFYWQLPVDISWMICLVWFAYDDNAYKKVSFWIFSTLSIILTFLTNGGREQALFVVICSLLVWTLKTSKLNIRLYIVLGLLIVFLIGLSGTFRQSSYTGFTRQADISTRSPMDFLVDEGFSKVSSRNWELNSMLPILAYVPDKYDYLYGETYLAVLTAPIPRSIWSNKPYISLGRRAGELFFNKDQVGIPAGAIGEAYWNFGIVGVIIIYYLFGMFHKFLAQFLIANYLSPFSFVFFSFSLFSFSPEAVVILQWISSIAILILILGFTKIIRFKLA